MRTAVVWALTAFTAVSALSVSTTSRCGANHRGLTCTGSTFGNCCSKYGYCGSDPNYCSSKNGCQSGYGKCDNNPPKASVISRDGSCGGYKGYVCKGSKFGDCCSQYGYCGSSPAYCGTGCNSVFGSCSSARSSSRAMSPSRTSTRYGPAASTSSRCSSATAASSTAKISTNNRCGYGNNIAWKHLGQSCPSDKCCSQYGWCGKADTYCGAKCQSAFGKCNSKSSSVRPSHAASTTRSSSPVLASSSMTRTPLASSAASSRISSLAAASSVSTSSLSLTATSTAVITSSSVSFSSSSAVLSSSSTASSTLSSVVSSASASTSTSAIAVSSSSASSIAISSSIIASSSVSAAPSSSDLVSSSSTIPSSTLATSVSSSLDSSSTTSSASSTVSCFPAPTEYLTNPGFEITTSGSYRNPWTDFQTGNAYTFDRFEGSDVYYSIYTRNENNFRTYFGTTMEGADGAQSSTLILTQTLSIPSGTVISVTAWVKSLRDASTDPFTMSLQFDDVVVATYSPTQDQRGVWIQIGTTDASQGLTVGSGTTHDVSLRVTTEGFANKDIFAADDFSVTALAGPDNVPVCSAGL